MMSTEIVKKSRRPCPLWWRITRTVLIGLLVSAAVAGALYVQTQLIPDLLAKLIEEEKENRAGFVEQLAYLAPVLAAMIIPYLLYCKIDRHDGRVQTELTWVTVITLALSFFVLLPYVAHVSDAEIQAALAAGEAFPRRDGGAYDSLLLKVAPWFIRLFIGLCILCLYHSMRAQREKAEAAAMPVNEGTTAPHDPAEAAPITDVSLTNDPTAATVNEVDSQPSATANEAP